VFFLQWFYFTRNAAYSGTDLILFAKPKFLVLILIPYFGLNLFIYVNKLFACTVSSAFTSTIFSYSYKFIYTSSSKFSSQIFYYIFFPTYLAYITISGLLMLFPFHLSNSSYIFHFILLAFSTYILCFYFVLVKLFSRKHIGLF